MKVLITDDSATIRMMLKGILKQLNVTDVVEAANGLEAIEVAGREPIRLVLLDIHMPTMDGLACLEKLKNDPKTAQLPVIIISSDTVQQQLDRARELGAHAYIKKPFRVEGLRDALVACVPEWQAPARA
jgi:two-component system chemotaxis response regulator CheY